MLQDGKDGVSRLTQVNLAGEIQAPNEVFRHGPGFMVFDSALLQFDLIPMLADQLVDKGSADGHVFLAGETSIEALFDCPARAGLSHEGFEADNFASYPGWLGSGTKRGPYRFMELSIVAWAAAQDRVGETYEVEKQDEEKCEHAEGLCCCSACRRV